MNWTTEFIEADNRMVHSFTNDVLISTCLTTGCTSIIKSGKIIDKRNNMGITDYEKFLINTAKALEDVTIFENEK